MADHRCPYCVSRPSTEFNIEHVIPAKLGGTLTIDAHAGCNDWSATHVDNPLMADWDVETLRAMSGVRNTRRGGQPKGAQFPANLDDQARVLLDVDTSGVRIRQVAAGTPIPSGEGEYTFTLGPGPTLAEQAERMLARIRAEHPGKTVNLIAQELRRSEVALDAQRRLRKDVWPRFAAKVALGALSQTMPEEWRGSDGWVSLMALYLAGLVIGSRGGRGLPALPSVLTNT